MVTIGSPRPMRAVQRARHHLVSRTAVPARTARYRATVSGSAGIDCNPTSSHQPVKSCHWAA